FLSEVKEGVTPQTIWLHTEVGNTQEAKKELLAVLPDAENVFITPKPTRLIERILQIATKPGDIVLDSFAGSGTTGHAVLKMNAQGRSEGLSDRRFVLIEMEEDIARPVTRERLKRAVDGYGKQEALGGGFRFCTLGETLLDAEGGINPNASWRDLAHFLYLQKFGCPPDSALFDQAAGFVGKAGNVSLFLLFRDGAVAPLDPRALRELNQLDGPKIVFCDCISVPPALLERAQITALQTPYEVSR
ncbi:MAG: site-specific DNA-methyltransferase, partial [Armatimonadetes bacterium]|nr:site-specific DNA-methyltransferase [Armatimonadota bacterium]